MTQNWKKDKNRKNRCSKMGLLELREKRGVKGMTSSWPFNVLHLIWFMMWALHYNV